MFMKKEPIKIIDSTLRDGSHAIRHQLSREAISAYCEKVDGSGIHAVVVGHGNGLGASSIQVGLSAISDGEMLSAARQALKKTKLGAFFLAGFATIEDDLAPALALGVDMVCVASHCTEADVTQQYISYLSERSVEVYGVLMMYHLTTKEVLLEEAKKMVSYGAQGILIMDSAGASTPPLVRETISHLVEHLDVPVGFHGHDNLAMAVGHSYMAIESGATIIDGTTRGFGAGAGNCQLEALVALLQKSGIPVDVDLYALLDASEDVVRGIMTKPQETDAISIVSGMAGVFSGFKMPVLRAAERFGIDARDLFMELGKRKVVGGQEDIVIEVAMELAEKNAQK